MATAPCLRCLLFGLPLSKTDSLDSPACSYAFKHFVYDKASFLRSPVMLRKAILSKLFPLKAKLSVAIL